MILKYSQIVGKPVMELRDQSYLGRVADVVLTKSNFKIASLIVKEVFFWPARKAVVESDISEITLEAVIINKEDDLSLIKELPRVKESLENGFSGIGHRVYNKSKKFVGRIYDYTFDSESRFLFKLYVKSVISERIIARTAIVEVKHNKVIIEDDFEAIKDTETVFQAETA